ncbi:MAG TPA: branched-chain amino acid ABC transporter substrate-binding protein [Cellulomonas sp.]
MRRSTPRLAGVALVTIAGLVLVGCSSKDTGTTTPTGGTTSASGGASAAALTIQPIIQVDATGKEAAATDTSKAADPAGDGKATCSGVSIAMMGALTGANAALGQNILNGVTLAVDEHNTANTGCQVQVKQFDTEGDPQKATQVAPSVVSDSSVIGIVGPAFSGESKATGPVFSQANLLMLTPSATNPALTTNGWKNFIRGLGNDNSQGGAAAAYMTGTLGFKKVCVVQDDSDYGVGLAGLVTKTLGAVADSSCASKVKTGDKDFSATVQIIKTAAPDAVYYAGYYAEAAPFVSQLRSGGVTAAFMSGDGTNDPQFVSQAGDASKGAYLTCPCGPAPDAYAAKYQAKFGQAPGVYSVEGYDLATIILKGIDSGIKDRSALVDFVRAYDGYGLAKHYKWDDTGELGATTTWIYQVK